MRFVVCEQEPHPTRWGLFVSVLIYVAHLFLNYHATYSQQTKNYDQIQERHRRILSGIEDV